MGTRAGYIFSLLTVTWLSVASSNGNEMGKSGIMMPNLHRNLIELWMCSPIKLNSSRDLYIVKFEPKATENVVHHMVLYGCLTLPAYKYPIWRCGGKTTPFVDSEIEYVPACGSKETVLYAWARNAPTLELPPDVGFRVAGSSDIQYLVLQIHYSSTIKNDGKGPHHELAATSTNFVSDGSTGLSGMFLHYTTQQTGNLAGLIILATLGSIPPMSEEHWETSCTLKQNKTIHPFAFRVHTHHFGKVVTGYRVIPDSDGHHHWTLIGRKDPQKPHMFYPVANKNTLTKGDIIAARCTYYNNKTTVVNFGLTDDDEMCFFYLMYYVAGNETLPLIQCWTEGAPSYYWKSELNNIPADASALELSA